MALPNKPSPLLYEVIWLGFAVVLAGLVLLPIYGKFPDFPFFTANFVYVLVAVTITRYLFLLDVSWLRDRLATQGAISLLLIPLIFWMVQYLNYFITYFDEQGPDVLTKHMDRDVAKLYLGYLHQEYRFFGVWAVIAALLLPFRLLYNVWVRYRSGVRRL